MKHKAIKVLILTDLTMICEGLVELFSQKKNFHVVGCAHNVYSAVELAGSKTPDIIIVEVDQGALGIANLRHLSDKLPDMPYLTVSRKFEEHFITECLHSGARGHVHAKEPFSIMIEAVEAVLNGEVYLCPSSKETVIDNYVKIKIENEQPIEQPLNRVEKEIISLFADGKTSKEIGSIICKSPKTVDAYRRDIMRRFSIESFAELIKFAVRTGLTSV